LDRFSLICIAREFLKKEPDDFVYGLSHPMIVRKLDDLVRYAVLLRDHGKCIQCPRISYDNDAGHVFYRIAWWTRWHPDGVFCQCRNDNRGHEEDKNTDGKKAMHIAIRFRIGEDRFAEIMNLKNCSVKIERSDFVALADYWLGVYRCLLSGEDVSSLNTGSLTPRGRTCAPATGLVKSIDSIS
jgi:hypothetical protein